MNKHPLTCIICGEKSFLSVPEECPIETVANVAIGYKCLRCLEESFKAIRIMADEEL
jgi:hypothetical protein